MNILLHSVETVHVVDWLDLMSSQYMELLSSSQLASYTACDEHQLVNA